MVTSKYFCTTSPLEWWILNEPHRPKSAPIDWAPCYKQYVHFKLSWGSYDPHPKWFVLEEEGKWKPNDPHPLSFLGLYPHVSKSIKTLFYHWIFPGKSFRVTNQMQPNCCWKLFVYQNLGKRQRKKKNSEIFFPFTLYHAFPFLDFQSRYLFESLFFFSFPRNQKECSK